MTSSFLNILKKRGFIADMTPGIEKALEKKPVFYLGIDPTADSLHIGHVLPLMMASWLQKAGCRPIILVGGGTGLIGDPSGKSKERPLLSQDEIKKNVTAIQKQISHLLSFEGENGAILVNNADWLVKFRLVDFLREIGKYFTINEMMGKESIKARFENRAQGISFTEFSYMILQSADFLYLFEKYNCRLQIGGTDQWGNITAGADLIRKKLGKQVHGLVCPLLTQSDGKKFGKTAGGAVWLDIKRTSPYQLYQYWLNMTDTDVLKFLKLFTFLSLEEIVSVESKLQKNPSARFAQKLLAKEFVTMVHGKKVTHSVIAASEFLFGGSVEALDDQAVNYLIDEVETEEIRKEDLGKDFFVSEIFYKLKLTGSKGEAKRLIDQGGAYINNEKISEDRLIVKGDLIRGKITLLRAGKKRYGIIHLVN